MLWWFLQTPSEQNLVCFPRPTSPKVTVNRTRHFAQPTSHLIVPERHSLLFQHNQESRHFSWSPGNAWDQRPRLTSPGQISKADDWGRIPDGWSDNRVCQILDRQTALKRDIAIRNPSVARPLLNWKHLNWGDWRYMRGWGIWWRGKW